MKPESISLKEVFAAIHHVAKPVLSPDRKGEAVLQYDHAVSIVKRFAAADAALYRVWVGEVDCPGMEKAFKQDETYPYLTAAEYNQHYKQSDAHVTNMNPYVVLNENHILTFEQASGYLSTIHLVNLIFQALHCRVALAQRFPQVTETAERGVRAFAALLDKPMRVRFPIFDSEAEALKNLALPSNPCDYDLQDVLQLRALYDVEFKNLITKKPRSFPSANTPFFRG